MPADHDREQRALLDAVWNDYDGDAPRLAYADWLDSVGDPADTGRAEYIRIECELARRTERRTDEPGLRLRRGQLLKQYQRAWLAGVPQRVGRPKSVRGFFSATLHYSPQRWLADGDDLTRACPPDVCLSVVLRPEYRKQVLVPTDWPALFACPWWARIEGLSVYNAELGPDGVRTIGSHAGFRRLRRLHLSGCRIGDDGACTLADAAYLESLRVLSVIRNDIGVNGAVALAARRHMPKLRRLDLGDNPIGVDGWTELEAVSAEEGGQVGQRHNGHPRSLSYGPPLGQEETFFGF